ncbi:MAG: glycosyltransferase family 9 protein [Hydrotalea sp.]|nr:glycosyltransferase family 9 protein [Hydrotalea sp.]
MNQQKKILIIKFGALGDVLLAAGQVRAIVARHAGDAVTILTEPAMVPLFKSMVQGGNMGKAAKGGNMGKGRKKAKVDFLTIKRKHYWWLPWLVVTLWARNFKRVYDLQTSGYSNRLYHLLLIKPLWNGVVKNIWQDKSRNRDAIHAVERFDRQLGYAGIGHVPPPNVDYLHGKKFSFFKKKFFMLVVGGSPSKIKRKQILPLETYIAVAKFLEAKNIFSVIVGGALEKSRAARFVAAVPSCINLVGKTTLGDVAEVARHAVGVVGNDTGLTHLAALAQLASPATSGQKKLRKTKGKKTRNNKKPIPIIVIIAPPAVPKLVRPLGDLKKSINIIYRDDPAEIKLGDILRHLPKRF